MEPVKFSIEKQDYDAAIAAAKVEGRRHNTNCILAQALMRTTGRLVATLGSVTATFEDSSKVYRVRSASGPGQRELHTTPVFAYDRGDDALVLAHLPVNCVLSEGVV